jgi:formate hydrogenlyase subunit 3/multisubunit Na+/H+ antiporter MnhD subunit
VGYPVALGAGGLALAGAARLRLFPFHGRPELARVSGRAYMASVLFGGLVGVALLARAGASGGPWLLTALLASASATALVAALALPLARRYRVALDLVGWVDAAHVAAALALGTPFALAVGLLYALNSAAARALLLLVADVASERGQQRRRLRGAPTLLPFGLGFGSLVGMPPLPGFVARWLVYLALLDGAAWPLALALALALVAAGALAELLRRIAAFGSPAGAPDRGPALIAALALLWLPLGLVVVTPVALLGGPLAGAAAALRPDAPWSLGADALLGVRGVVALLLALVPVVVGFALYAERELGPLRRPIVLWRRLTGRAARPGLGAAALGGLPWRWLGLFGELLGEVLNAALAPWEERFLAVGVLAAGLVVVLVALG